MSDHLTSISISVQMRINKSVKEKTFIPRFIDWFAAFVADQRAIVNQWGAQPVSIRNFKKWFVGSPSLKVHQYEFFDYFIIVIAVLMGHAFLGLVKDFD